MGCCNSYTCKNSHDAKDAEIERLRAAMESAVTIKDFGSRSDEWLAGFQAGVEAKAAAITAAFADEQSAQEK